MDARLAYLGPDNPTEEQLLARLYAEPLPLISCDVETISTTDQTLIGIGLGLNCRESVYLQVFPQGSRYLDLAWSILDRAGAVVFHNGIFDLTALLEYFISDAPWWGGEVGGLVGNINSTVPGKMAVPPLLQRVAAKAHDTSLALQVQGLGPLNLQWTAHNYAGTEIDTISDILPARKTMLDLPWEDTANKCLHDCQATLRLWHQMRGPEWGNGSLTWTHEPNFAGPGFDPTEPTTHYVSARMQDCYEIDRQLIALLLRMTARGIALRQDRVQEWYEKLSKEKWAYRDILVRYGIEHTGYGDFNPSSNQNIGTLLAKRGSMLPFTKSKKQLKVDEEILETLTDPLAAVVLEYRKRDKMLGTYIRPCLNQRRCYSHFRQDLSTSRLSSSNINLQNWPEPARDVLAPDNGIWSWMDYDQLETRWLATASGEPALLAAYERGDDAHWITQQRFWPGTSRDDQTYRLRAKTGNHAMAYRAQDFTLARHMGVPRSAASEFRAEWLQAYPEIDRWQVDTIEQGWEHGWVENLFGRRCRLPTMDIAKPNHIEKCAVNYPIQSGAADLVKRAMLHPDVAGMDLALQVHDELLTDGAVEFPEALANLGPLHTPFKTKHSPIWV